MLTETARSVHPVTETPWGAGQPSLPRGSLAGGFPTHEEIE